MDDTTSDVSVVKMYAAREVIYPREVSGRYASVRWFFVWLTQLIFYGLPWLNWNGRQAVLFDLTARRFCLSRSTTDYQRLFLVFIYSDIWARMVWLYLSTNSLYRNLYVDRTQD
jgi:polyferredoxin